MRVPLSWLRDFVELKDSPEVLCDRLSFAGVEAEIAQDGRVRWPGVVTAELRDVQVHPNADRLTVTRPWDGSTERQVVCGATNHRRGDIVALATAGTTLPGDFKITRSKIRGEPSEGMLCSERELGLSAESEGILVLPPGTPVGVPLDIVLQRGDVILEVSPTANRGDCLSILGLAREVAAVTGWALTERALQPWDADGGTETLRLTGSTGADRGQAGVAERVISIRIDAQDACPRYAAAVMTGVAGRSTPGWMRERLEAVGFRSLGAVVDCTNYVMLELGNPLHAFDLWSIRGQQIVVRKAETGECLTTLDGRAHTLAATDLVIADGEGPVALAGVMGGSSSEIHGESSDLLLESAQFAPADIRLTSRRIRVQSEASLRFARGVDPGLPRAALLRLVGLLAEITGARLVGAAIDLCPEPILRRSVLLRQAQISATLGIEVPAGRVAELLVRDGCDVDTADGGHLVRIPTARFDLEREIDLIEEVARLQGYDALPESRPERPLVSTPRRAPGPDRDALRLALTGVGLSECVHLSFEDDRALAALGVGDDDPLRARMPRIGNPLSEVGASLRSILLPSMLRTVSRNRRAGSEDLRVFELRPVFALRQGGLPTSAPGDRPTDQPPLDERLHLVLCLTGHRDAPSWSGPCENIDFFDVKGLAELVVRTLGAVGPRWEAAEDAAMIALPWLEPREAAVLRLPGRPTPLGWMGRISVEVLRAYEIDAPVYSMELDIEALAPRKPREAKHRAFSRFPGSERDLALTVPDGIAASSLLETAARIGKKALGDAFCGVRVFDVYRGPNLPVGTRSLALRFQFRALDRTLSESEIDGVMAQLQGKLADRDGVEIRR